VEGRETSPFGSNAATGPSSVEKAMCKCTATLWLECFQQKQENQW
jgi:hypothetical protein